jgi:hypothetical protein
MGSLSEECVLTDGEVSAACKDYNEKMEQLAEMVGDQVKQVSVLKNFASEMKAIKISVASSGTGNADSPEMRAAIEEAKKVSADKGATSSEAKLAWETVEEIASSGLSNSMGARLDEECLVETAMDACMALEELSRALNLQKGKELNF